MNVELFVLCDAATDYQGKLNILGTFDAIRAKETPVVYPLCTVALRMRFLKTEEGEHKIRISIADEDGNAIIKPVEANINVQFKSTPLTSIATNLVLNLQRLQFPKCSEYSIDLAIDGRHEASLPLFINRIQEHSNN